LLGHAFPRPVHRLADRQLLHALVAPVRDPEQLERALLGREAHRPRWADARHLAAVQLTVDEVPQAHEGDARRYRHRAPVAEPPRIGLVPTREPGERDAHADEPAVEREPPAPELEQLERVAPHLGLVEERVAEAAAGEHADHQPDDQVVDLVLVDRQEPRAGEALEDPLPDEEREQEHAPVPPQVDRVDQRQQHRVPGGVPPFAHARTVATAADGRHAAPAGGRAHVRLRSRPMRELLSELERVLPAAERQWLEDAGARAEREGASAVRTLLPALPRRLGRQGFATGLRRIGAATIDLGAWRRCDVAAAALLSLARADDGVLLDLHAHGDLEERTMVLRAATV